MIAMRWGGAALAGLAAFALAVTPGAATAKGGRGSGYGYSSPRYSAPKSYRAPTYKVPSQKAPSYSTPKSYAPPRSRGTSPPNRAYSAPKAPQAPKYKANKSRQLPNYQTKSGSGVWSGGAASGNVGKQPRHVAGKMKAQDGDTFYSGGVRYRVQGIDTPELGTPRADAAKNRLQQLLSSGNVTVEPVAKDRYGRTVARVRVNGEDVSDVLRREGYEK